MQDIIKKCSNCGKEFVISKESQEIALKKGGNVGRVFCHSCLLRWRKGEISLEQDDRK